MTPPHSRGRGPTAGRMLGVFGMLMAVSLRSLAQDAAVVGAWGPPFGLPLIAIHSIVLPTGRVLLFSAEHGVPGIHGWVLDPTSLTLTNVPPPQGWNPDCAGHSFLPDGRLVVAGGTLSFTPLTGTKLSYLFDPYAEQWTALPNMAGGRWYPTCVTRDDGTVLTVSGLSEVAGAPNPDIELWNSALPYTWQLLGQRALPYYPLLHLMPSGRVFMAGPDALTETYDPAADTWTPIATTNSPGRYEACSVLLPPTPNRVMLVGGRAGSGQPASSAEIIDLADPEPRWQLTAHMSFARMEHNAVLLPDGKVLVVGGRSDNDSTPTPVLTPEIFDPAARTWTPVAAHAVPRRYHSTAVLLPDGRVLAAGGDYQPSGEIYSPPYLFRGPRPAIVSAPTTITFGSTFSVQFTGTTSAHSAVLMGLPCVTHSNNMCQRHVSLGSIPSAGGTVDLQAPADGKIAPPGFYMLFIVDSNGVPSVSRMMRLAGCPLLGLALSGTGDDTLLSWDKPGAASYCVVRGDLGALGATGGDFRQSLRQELASRETGNTLLFSGTPAAGNGYWFLVKDSPDGSFDSGCASQVGSRDDEILSAGDICVN